MHFLPYCQADDYHLDRQLYFACQHDREVFCADVQSGEGRVYDCLMKNQDNQKLSPKVRADTCQACHFLAGESRSQSD